jgi:hypothetical protein
MSEMVPHGHKDNALTERWNTTPAVKRAPIAVTRYAAQAETNPKSLTKGLDPTRVHGALIWII